MDTMLLRISFVVFCTAVDVL